jgi:uncharacterized protein (TIGR03790 family)
MACALFVGVGAAPAWAELQPEEVAVIAAKGHRGSEDLARYYLKTRGVPTANLCLVDVPGDEVCPRDTWTWAVRPEISKWLEEHDPDKRLRCLVTMWGVPLKIGPAPVDEKRLAYQQFLEGERRQRFELVAQLGQQLDAIAPDVIVPGAAGTASEAAAADEDAKTQAGVGAELLAAQKELETHLKAAQARLARLAGDEQLTAAARLQHLATLAGGARVVLQGLEKRLAAEPTATELRTQYDLLRGRASGLAEMQGLLDQLPMGYDHDALVLAVLERNVGLLGTIHWLDEQLKVVASNETGASFDSELSLVMWPDDYELLRWQPNYLRAGYAESQWPKAFRTLMVARLDGPTVDHARGLVDAALAAERDGLTGKAYFDARGLGKLDEPNVAPGSYADYDRALLAAAKMVGELTTLETVVDEEPELFPAGACPDAALYCGWYSLAKYVDAFDWSPGAVAYHLASGEAKTLRDPGSQVWCKRMIEDGVAATIGPVYEPYLVAFPRPEQFFALLVEGESTLVECYYRTLPYNSWMMTLIGDPLYRPFKNRGVMKGTEGPR